MISQGVVVLVCAWSLLAVLAAVRARTARDPFSWMMLLCFGMAASLAVVFFHIDVTTKEAVAAACVCVAAATDASSGYVYDIVTYAAASIIVAVAAFEGTMTASIVGSVCALGTAGLLFAITRRRGIGLGDVKLLAVVGAALSVLPTLAVFCAAFIGGGLYAATGLILKRLVPTDRIAFAPYIAAATTGVVIAHGVH